jgi:hypothetical protein
MMCFSDAGTGGDSVPVCSIDGAMSIAPGISTSVCPPNTQSSSPQEVLVPRDELCTIQRGTEII